MTRKIRKKTDSYTHEDKKRKNNPPVGLVSSATDKVGGKTKYKHDPHIDPYLSWAGKSEGVSFEVPNVSLHVHERIDPSRLTRSFVKEDKGPKQSSLFEQEDNQLPLNKAIDFYAHEQDWTNRLIAGDSLLVMNSLLQKEGMAGKIQMIYIDPPYGIKYNSNFQPFVNKRDVKDRDEDIPAEPEMIHAFRDTWELGIHSYLSHLRDRLLLTRELLHESGSCFVQINDENVHHIKELMDEVFSPSNLCGIIIYQKTGYATTTLLAPVCDYLVWYAKDISKVKYRKLFRQLELEEKNLNLVILELPGGEVRRLKREEKLNPALIPKGSRLFESRALTSQGRSSRDDSFKFKGELYKPAGNQHWKTTIEGMKRLAKKGRILVARNSLRYKRYIDDFNFGNYTNIWTDTITGSFTQPKIFVVQTATKVVERCLLMTTDPGDLVFDPTCGSGTTGYVAEQWGRRWITCDTSRVAITLAKQRLMTSNFDYYQLAHPDEGVSSGFNYKKVPHKTLKSIANNELPKEEVLYDQPLIERSKVRVTGPFTVEAVPSLRVKPLEGGMPRVKGSGKQLGRMGETANEALWREELKATGVRTTGGKKIEFSRVDPLAGTSFLHAEADILEGGKTKVAVISFGPEFGPLEQRQVEGAMSEAREMKPQPEFVIFAAFHFDPEAAKDIDQIKWKSVTILKAQMSADLLTLDLRKKRSSNQSYWLIGQPDVEVVKGKKKTYKVKVKGFDYYNPVTGEIESGGVNKIAMWFLDTDYDEQSLFPEQVFFPIKNDDLTWDKLAKALNSDVDKEALEAYTGMESLSFKSGENKKIAVKIIDDRGIESFVVKTL